MGTSAAYRRPSETRKEGALPGSTAEATHTQRPAPPQRASGQGHHDLPPQPGRPPLQGLNPTEKSRRWPNESTAGGARHPGRPPKGAKAEEKKGPGKEKKRLDPDRRHPSRLSTTTVATPHHRDINASLTVAGRSAGFAAASKGPPRKSDRSFATSEWLAAGRGPASRSRLEPRDEGSVAPPRERAPGAEGEEAEGEPASALQSPAFKGVKLIRERRPPSPTTGLSSAPRAASV